MAFYLSLFFEPPEAGWTSYPPLSNSSFLGSGGIDAWIFLIHLTGASTVIGGYGLRARRYGKKWSQPAQTDDVGNPAPVALRAELGRRSGPAPSRHGVA
jgi:hypothetical protein